MRISNRNTRLTLLLLCLLTLDSFADTTDISMPTYWSDEVVVIADRVEGIVKKSITATNVLTSTAINQLPVDNLTDVLKYIPGLTFVDEGGSGNTPVAIVRGFYGGGEAEYILLAVDGVPVNDLRTGLIEWNQIPLSAVDRIEILRGGGSAVYGDAAIGAVINIITQKSSAQKPFSSNLAIGQDNEQSLNLAYRSHLDKHSWQIQTNGKQGDGFRAHANSENYQIGGKYNYELTANSSFHFSGNFQRLNDDDPGPLTPVQIDADRTQSNSLCIEDYRQRDVIDFSGGYIGKTSLFGKYSVDAGVRSVNQEQVKTFILSQYFGDSQFLDEDSYSIWTHIQANPQTKIASLVLGIDSEYGGYNSHYFDYQDRDNEISSGDGKRYKLGAYVEARRDFTDRLRASAGCRYDLINNNFNQGAAETEFTKLTPRIGFNYAYMIDNNQSGNIYANFSQSFKAPTLDQLFGQRQIRINSLPPIMYFNFSNALLKPQRSDSYEIGIYQRIPLARYRIYSELALSAYRIDLEDEIDFDLTSYMYDNIVKSRHDGFEGSLAVHFMPWFSLNNTINLMEVTFSGDQNTGNQLKNIPRTSFTNSLSFNPGDIARLTIAHNYFGEIYLDDENTVKLPSHSTFDALVQANLEQFRFYANIMNLTDKEYNSNGYTLFDPIEMTNVSFLYPARGRYMQIGVEFAF